MHTERNQGNHSSNRQVWTFMAATAMATTVATMTATAMTGSTPEPTPEPTPVTCECAFPEASTPAPAAPALVDPFQADAPAAVPLAESEPEQRASELDEAAQQQETRHDTPKAPSMTVEGPLDKAVIRRIVRAHIGEVRYCYNEGLREDPELGGKVVVQMTIGEDGKVRESEVASTTLEDSDVPECIAQAAGRWMFPKNADAEPVTVTYPFVLEPG